jgi:hypothetical protein
MKKTLQECKEIVAKENGFDSWIELQNSSSLNYTLIVHNLANKMYYEQNEWVLCDDDMPEIDETVWITNGCGWTALGCLVECEGGYCWAVTNGIIYEDDGKIVSECELDDDYDVVYWHRLPSPPLNNKTMEKKPDYKLIDAFLTDTRGYDESSELT